MAKVAEGSCTVGIVLYGSGFLDSWKWDGWESFAAVSYFLTKCLPDENLACIPGCSLNVPEYPDIEMVIFECKEEEASLQRSRFSLSFSPSRILGQK